MKTCEVDNRKAFGALKKTQGNCELIRQPLLNPINDECVLTPRGSFAKKRKLIRFNSFVRGALIFGAEIIPFNLNWVMPA
jgi:hypothetical protein